MDTLLQKLWLYNDWANIALLDSLMAQQPGHVIPAKTMKLLSHIMTAQSIWIDRLKGVKPSVGVWEEFDLEGCRQLQLQSSSAIEQLLNMPDVMLQENLTYTNTQGKAFTNQKEDILLHIFNHATYHRAQIAQDLRLNGLEPINTDYITFVRK